MIFSGWLLLQTMTIMQAVIKMSERQVLLYNTTMAPTKPSPTFNPTLPDIGASKAPMTVSDFGRKTLCSSYNGKKYFFDNLLEKFCNLSRAITAGHVINLCNEKDLNLDHWVAAIFDLDSDGYIDTT